MSEPVEFDPTGAAKQLASLIRTNTDGMNALVSRGAAPPPAILLQQRLNMLMDFMLGPMPEKGTVDALADVQPARLMIELAWHQWMRSFIAHHTRATAGLVVPKENGNGSGLVLPR